LSHVAGRPERVDRVRQVGLRREARHEHLELDLGAMRGGRDDLVDVGFGEVRRQHHHAGDMQAAVGDRVQHLREAPRRTRRADALERDLVGEPQDLHAVRVHRPARGGQEELARLDLTEVREQSSRRLLIGRDQRGEVGEQRGIGDMRQDMRGHDSTYHDDFCARRMPTARRSASKHCATTLDPFSCSTTQLTRSSKRRESVSRRRPRCHARDRQEHFPESSSRSALTRRGPHRAPLVLDPAHRLPLVTPFARMAGRAAPRPGVRA
jgi:hypothetical protein